MKNIGVLLEKLLKIHHGDNIIRMKGIILHGGNGTRLRPLTHTGPKQLLPIANRPMSEYCIESLKEAGIKDIAVVIGGIGSERVQEYYNDGEKFGVNLTYVKQDYPKGIADAINLCRDFIGNDKFVVFLGDNIILKSIAEYVYEFKNNDVDASILLCEVDNPSRFGIANIENEKIKEIIEKPKNPPTNLAVTGIYFLTPIIFEIIKNLKPSWRNELEITDALDLLLKANGNISYHIITDYWKDTGTPEDILHANKVILENSLSKILGIVETGVKMEGKIIVEEGALIEESVELIGPVLIGKNSIIKKGSKIGPNTTIGDDCVIDKVKIKNSIIMNNSKILIDLNVGNSIIASNSELDSKLNFDEVRLLLGEGTKIFL